MDENIVLPCRGLVVDRLGLVSGTALATAALAVAALFAYGYSIVLYWRDVSAEPTTEKRFRDREKQMRPLTEQVILITRATDGLGKVVAMQLARTGATLLLHGRDEARGQHTLEEYRAQTGNTRLHWYRADFSAPRAWRTLPHSWSLGVVISVVD